MASETTFDHALESRFLREKSEKNLIFSKPSQMRILISWNLSVDTFFCTKIKKFTIVDFFSLDAGSRPMCAVLPPSPMVFFNSSLRIK